MSLTAFPFTIILNNHLCHFIHSLVTSVAFYHLRLGLVNVEVAAHNVPTPIGQGKYLGQIPQLSCNTTTTKETVAQEKLNDNLSIIKQESTCTLYTMISIHSVGMSDRGREKRKKERGKRGAG